MTERTLQGRCILLVEDEFLLADDLAQALSAAGATVVGPVPSVRDAAAILAGGQRIDAAVLDINLRGDMVFPVADTLVARGIPFAFASGYDRSVLPARFVAVPHVEKPLEGRRIAAILAPLISGD